SRPPGLLTRRAWLGNREPKSWCNTVPACHAHCRRCNANGVAMIPQGALDLSSALNRLSGREVAADRSEGEKAWRFLCALILERRVVTPYCLTESGETVELARDQFAGLAEKWIFVATEPLQYCTRTECQVGRFYGPARSKWRDTHGRL